MSTLSIAEPRALPNALSAPEELRPFAQVKLIAFDLDGTLISKPDEQLGQRLTRLFELVSRSNIFLTLATGRTLAGVLNSIAEVKGLSRIPLVLYNGSVVMHRDNRALISHNQIPNSSAQRVVELAKEYQGTAVYIYCIDTEADLLTSSSKVESVFYVGRAPKPSTDFNGMPVQEFDTLDWQHCKVVAVLIASMDPDVKEELCKKLDNVEGISATSSGPKYIEIRPLGSSKADGIEKLCRHYGITAKNVLALGDNDNDSELLSWAGLSVCVDSSSPSARRASRFFSSHGAGNAAIEILQIVRRAQRLFREGK